MGRGGAAGCGARGGEVVPASRAGRARLTAAAAAVAGAGGVAAWLALAPDDPVLRVANATAGGFALVLLLGGLLLRIPAAVPATLVVLGTEYAAMLAVEGGALDGRAPVLAAALFAIAELGYWSLELRDAVADEAGTYLRRLGLLSALTLGALALGELLLALVDVSERSGIAIEAVGVVAAVAALAIVALSSRREPGL